MSQESRRRSMEDYLEDATRCAEVGKILGRVFRENFVPTFEDFMA